MLAAAITVVEVMKARRPDLVKQLKEEWLWDK